MQQFHKYIHPSIQTSHQAQRNKISSKPIDYLDYNACTTAHIPVPSPTGNRYSPISPKRTRNTIFAQEERKKKPCDPFSMYASFTPPNPNEYLTPCMQKRKQIPSAVTNRIQEQAKARTRPEEEENPRLRLPSFAPSNIDRKWGNIKERRGENNLLLQAG